MSRELTAKDKAFVREKQKLQKEIRMMYKLADNYKKEAMEKTIELAKLQNKYDALLAEINISDGDFESHLERVKKNEETLKLFRTLIDTSSMFGSIY